MAQVSHHTLADQFGPAYLTISRVSDQNADLLRHLKTIDMLPGTAIELVEQEPYGGAFLVRVGGREVRVAPQAARSIYIEKREA